jgi:hypothetical protein
VIARELRLTYSVAGMTRVIDYIDGMKLGELPDFMAVFLAHASNAANWHPVVLPEEDQC